MIKSPTPTTQNVVPTGTVHTCKSWPRFFQEIKAGNKLHDMRDMHDRDYRVGDILELCEYDPFNGAYTGEKCKVMVTYITSSETPCAFSSAALLSGFCILSLKLMGDTDE